MTKVLILANDESTIIHFRKEILRTFIQQKFQVIVCYPLGEHAAELRQMGCETVNIAVSRHGKNVLQDLKLLRECKALIQQYKPDVVLTYTVKPNIYGSFACQSTKTPYINNITGLGSVLQSQSVLSKLILTLQKYAYKDSSCVFFQNSENYKSMLEAGVISPQTPVHILPGSGVNLQMQTYEEFPADDGITRFIIVSRVRADKGYNEFFDAAEKIKRNYPNTEFHVVGWYEEDALKQRVDELHDRGVIIYHGSKTQEEVHALIKNCSCLVHPSYHEGMANVLLEAAATGRPVIATDIPGCRETFEEGVTGFGCRVRDAESLAQAMEKLIHTPYDRQVEMGKRGRRKMEREFDRDFVAKAYIERITKEEEKEYVLV